MVTLFKKLLTKEQMPMQNMRMKKYLFNIQHVKTTMIKSFQYCAWYSILFIYLFLFVLFHEPQIV
jgi:hypothetical protein